jgi:hypothetical protein
MGDDHTTVEEQLAELLGLLRPAPAAWVRAAQELPFARAAVDDVLERADRDEAFCDALRADLEATLFDAGVAPTPELLEEVRAHIVEPPLDPPTQP